MSYYALTNSQQYKVGLLHHKGTLLIQAHFDVQLDS